MAQPKTDDEVKRRDDLSEAKQEQKHLENQISATGGRVDVLEQSVEETSRQIQWILNAADNVETTNGLEELRNIVGDHGKRLGVLSTSQATGMANMGEQNSFVAEPPDEVSSENEHEDQEIRPDEDFAEPPFPKMCTGDLELLDDQDSKKVPEIKMEEIKKELVDHDGMLAEHDMRMASIGASAYDGTYIWRIDEFSRRQHEAIIGTTPSIYSPPFYVGRYGYKVCARVYPNGDENGTGTHLSLFFVIMKGEYDALLPWPFRQKVTFKLLDHDRQNDITDTFRPDPNSSSFKRPTSSMNIASGCPVFVTQQNLQKRSYVNDDTMFIKIMVDTTGIPDFQ